MRTMTDNSLDLEFTTDGTPELVVRGHTGDISIRSTHRSTIRLHADNFEAGHHPHGAESRIASQSGNQVTIDLHRNHTMLRANLQLEVPVGCPVTVNTIDGDIQIQDTRASVDLNTVSGDIRLHRTEGTAQITTVGGDVQGEQLAGALTLQTTNGDVSLRNSTLRRFNVHSVNGDLVIETPLERGEHYFARTTNGDVRLCVPGDTAATVQMRTTNGDFHSDLPAEVINPSRRNWQGRINGGGANVELETLNGDVIITLSKTFDGETSAPMPPHTTLEMPEIPDLPEMPHLPEMPEMPDLPELPRMPRFTQSASETLEAEPRTSGRNYTGTDSIEILAQLERGDITVEEAMRQLDELR